MVVLMERASVARSHNFTAAPGVGRVTGELGSVILQFSSDMDHVAIFATQDNLLCTEFEISYLNLNALQNSFADQTLVHTIDLTSILCLPNFPCVFGRSNAAWGVLASGRSAYAQ